VKFVATAMAIVLLAITGCKDEAKIEASKAEFDKERSELMARLKKKKGEQVVQTARAQEGPAGPAVPTAAAGSAEPAFAPIADADFTYDPRGLRDPFRSYEWERATLEEAEVRGPLEEFDVNQLSVVGVVWNVGNARALIQDPSGQGFIVGEGARVGKNDGRIIKIDDSVVIVKETYVDMMGQETTKDIELRIRRSEGG
jgi:Tfp pilus assembly protein PilP